MNRGLPGRFDRMEERERQEQVRVLMSLLASDGDIDEENANTNNKTIMFNFPERRQRKKMTGKPIPINKNYRQMTNTKIQRLEVIQRKRKIGRQKNLDKKVLNQNRTNANNSFQESSNKQPPTTEPLKPKNTLRRRARNLGIEIKKRGRHITNATIYTKHDDSAIMQRSKHLRRAKSKRRKSSQRKPLNTKSRLTIYSPDIKINDSHTEEKTEEKEEVNKRITKKKIMSKRTHCSGKRIKHCNLRQPLRINPLQEGKELSTYFETRQGNIVENRKRTAAKDFPQTSSIQNNDVRKVNLMRNRTIQEKLSLPHSDNKTGSSIIAGVMTKASKEPINKEYSKETITKRREKTASTQGAAHENESSTDKQSSGNQSIESAREKNLFETSVVYCSLLDKLYDRIKKIGLTKGSYA